MKTCRDMARMYQTLSKLATGTIGAVIQQHRKSQVTYAESIDKSLLLLYQPDLLVVEIPHCIYRQQTSG